MNKINELDYPAELEKCEDFSDVFELVKKAVKDVLGKWRVGLMLVLADLPLSIGAYHSLGSNSIVMNRKILEAVKNSTKSKRKLNLWIFLVLLHEYLHSLGYIDEFEVKTLSIKIISEKFGKEHPLTQLALKGLTSIFSENILNKALNIKTEQPKLIKSFEKINQPYIQ
jgi:hypothetical protein